MATSPILRRTRWVLVLALLLAGGCRARSPGRSALPRGAGRLTGVWGATLVVTRSPLRVDSAALRRSGHDRVRGAVSFLPLSGGEPPLAGSVPELGDAVPVAYAVWDLDFAPAGFDPRPEGDVPAAVAAVDTATTTRGAEDTVRVVLGPSTPLRLVLVGTWHRDSLVGTWQTVTSDRVGVVAAGTFTLVPRGATAGR